jgi:two-component system response regulator FixJ
LGHGSGGAPTGAKAIRAENRAGRARATCRNAHHQEELARRAATLTTSEREVLLRVLEGMPNKQIAQELDIGLRTVELRRSEIMSKFQANSLPELVRMAIRAGILPRL